MVEGLIEIVILLDGHQHGMRYWPSVPRIGELLEIADTQGHVFDAVVTKILWRKQDLKEFGRGECRVTLWVEPIAN